MNREELLREEVRFRLALAYKQQAVIAKKGCKKKKMLNYLSKCEEVIEQKDRYFALFSIITKYIKMNKEKSDEKSNLKSDIFSYLKEELKTSNKEALHRAGSIPDYIMPQFIFIMSSNKELDKNKDCFKTAAENVIEGISELLHTFSNSPNVLAAWHYSLALVYEKQSDILGNNSGEITKLIRENLIKARNNAYYAEKSGTETILDGKEFGEIQIDKFIAQIEDKINEIRPERK